MGTRVATVLIVDDERSYRRYISARLIREGFDVHVAADGEESVTLAASKQPDVLVVDWRLGPDVSGLDLAAELQRRDPALRTILITGYSSEALAHADDDISVFRCLEKPFEIEALVRAVRDALAAPTILSD